MTLSWEGGLTHLGKIVQYSVNINLDMARYEM